MFSLVTSVTSNVCPTFKVRTIQTHEYFQPDNLLTLSQTVHELRRLNPSLYLLSVCVIWEIQSFIYVINVDDFF